MWKWFMHISSLVWQKYFRGDYAGRPHTDFTRDLREELGVEHNPPAPRVDDEGGAFLALERMRALSYLTPEARRKDELKADWQYVHPGLALWSAYFIKECRKHGIPLYVHTAYRTPADQLAAYERGVSGTRPPRAAHVQGMAVDIVHSRFHWDLTGEEWATLHRIGVNVHTRLMQAWPAKHRFEIKCGIEWRNPWDPAHWEVVGWQDNIRDRPSLVPMRRPIDTLITNLRAHMGV